MKKCRLLSFVNVSWCLRTSSQRQNKWVLDFLSWIPQSAVFLKAKTLGSVLAPSLFAYFNLPRTTSPASFSLTELFVPFFWFSAMFCTSLFCDVSRRTICFLPVCLLESLPPSSGGPGVFYMATSVLTEARHHNDCVSLTFVLSIQKCVLAGYIIYSCKSLLLASVTLTWPLFICWWAMS